MGFAYVLFKDSEVAKVVAETMNNYLMFGKLMKCEAVNPHLIKKRIKQLKEVTPTSNPTVKNRRKNTRKLNKDLKSMKLIQSNAAKCKKYNKKLAKLKELGIDIELFSFADVSTVRKSF